MKEKALVVGSGGREYALAEYIARSPLVGEVYCAPGNGGTELIAHNVGIEIKDVDGITRFCVENEVDLAVIGPDDSLEAGVVDALKEEGVQSFGPNRAAARLEWDKSFADEFMNRQGIPHPKGWIFDDVDDAKEQLNFLDAEDIVIKANGLAQGKGVILPATRAEGRRALNEMMISKKLGSAGEKVILQERLNGKELSVFAICHGGDYCLLPLCQDYKRRDNGDKGANTGGMGAVAPANIIDQRQLAEIEQEIVQPTLQGMVEEGNPFKGVLYTGIMLASSGPKVIEYNVRFGDPECQALLPLIDADIYSLLSEAAKGNIIEPKAKDLASALIVLASGNYPAGRWRSNKRVG